VERSSALTLAGRSQGAVVLSAEDKVYCPRWYAGSSIHICRGLKREKESPQFLGIEGLRLFCQTSFVWLMRIY